MRLRLLLVGLALLLLPRCEGVPLMSPDGATILIQANPTFVAANGGRSVVTAVLSEPAGTFVPDGTVVFFFADLGQVDARAETVDGLARVYFVADSRSGQACVTAYSGGAPPTGCVASGDGTGSAQTGASVQIGVGSALPKLVIVTAGPERITNPRHATIVANVYDESGNPVQNVPVVFTITEFGSVLEETLDSGGSPRFTDSTGRAFDTLRTRALTTEDPRTVTVSASVPGIETDATVSVWIN
jgi:hypothetical protein